MKLDKGLKSTTTDHDDHVSITNSSGTNLHVLNSFNESDKALKTVYENTLTLFSTIEGKEVIEDKQTASIKLTGNTFTYDGKTLPGFSYNLLFVEPKIYFPISIAYVSNLDGPYGSITVTEKEKKILKESAWSFYQRILAYPTSDLALDFLQALKESAHVGNVDAVDAYFQATKSYKDLDFKSVQLVMSYMKNYAGAWCKNQSECTFYLYASLDKEKPLKLQEPVLIGRLEFTKQDLSFPKIDLTKGYTISFKDDNGIDIPVEFLRGLFREDSLSLSLAPTFMPKSRLDGNIKEDEIIPFIYGQVNGISVVGVKEKIVPNEKPSQGTPYAFWSFDSFSKLVAASVLGGLILLAIYATAKFVYAKIRAKMQIRDSEVSDGQLEAEHAEESVVTIEDGRTLNGETESLANDNLRELLELQNLPSSSNFREVAINRLHESIKSARCIEYHNLLLREEDLIQQWIKLKGVSPELQKCVDDIREARIRPEGLKILNLQEFMDLLASRYDDLVKIHQFIKSEISQDTIKNIQEKSEEIDESLRRFEESFAELREVGAEDVEQTKVKELEIIGGLALEEESIV